MAVAAVPSAAKHLVRVASVPHTASVPHLHTPLSHLFAVVVSQSESAEQAHAPLVHLSLPVHAAEVPHLQTPPVQLSETSVLHVLPLQEHSPAVHVSTKSAARQSLLAPHLQAPDTQLCIPVHLDPVPHLHTPISKVH